jgi:hypothetical protein
MDRLDSNLKSTGPFARQRAILEICQARFDIGCLEFASHVPRSMSSEGKQHSGEGLRRREGPLKNCVASLVARAPHGHPAVIVHEGRRLEEAERHVHVDLPSLEKADCDVGRRYDADL